MIDMTHGKCINLLTTALPVAEALGANRPFVLRARHALSRNRGDSPGELASGTLMRTVAELFAGIYVICKGSAATGGCRTDKDADKMVARLLKMPVKHWRIRAYFWQQPWEKAKCYTARVKEHKQSELDKLTASD